MKKLIYFLALCLCLNGTAALATAEGETAPPDVPAGQVEGAAQAEPAGEAEPGVQAEPAQGQLAEQSAEQDAEQTVKQTVEQPAEQTVEQPAEQTGEQAGEQPTVQSGDQTGEQTVEQPAEQGAEPTGEQTADQTAGQGAVQNGEQAGEQAGAQAGEQAGEQSGAQAGAPVDGESAAAAADKEASEEQPPAENAPAENELAENAPAEEQPAAETPAEARFEAASGTLEALLAQIEGSGTVYLRVDLDKRVFIEKAPLKKLSQLTLEPDKEVFPDGENAVYIASDEPRGNAAPALVDPAQYAEAAPEDVAALYFWVDKKGKYDQPQPQPEPSEAPAPALTVAAERYTPAAWSNEAPAFTLSGIPEGAKYSYAAIIYDERIALLSGNTFSPDTEGQYSVRFAMVDGIGDIVNLSDGYQIWYDRTAPENVRILQDEAVSFALHIQASDSLSGVAGVSMDGGASWTDLANDEVYTYIGAAAESFSIGAIQVKDAAGNVWRTQSVIETVAVVPEPGGGGGGGGGGGSGEKKPNPSHASGDGEERADYESLELELPEEPMTRLTVGGEEMPLELVLDFAPEAQAPVGREQPFTARLRGWAPAPSGEDAHENVLADASRPAQDTLVLEAELDPSLGDEYTYTWRFNGEVYRLLANSGIRYVALKVGDDVAAFPTEGFTGGTKYTELKMLGVSTRKFDYTLTMRVNRDPGFVSAMSDSDFSRDCDLSIRAVVENMAYELSSSTNSVMYFYNVYLGPEDMLNVPFGTYAGE